MGSAPARRRRPWAGALVLIVSVAVCASVIASAAEGAPVPNPPLERGRCGLTFSLVVDTSASIFEAGSDNPELMRSGAATLLEALQGTASVGTVVSFRNNAVTELPATELEDPAGYRQAVQAVRGIEFDTVGFGPEAGTNWEAALRAVRLRTGGTVELVLFLTDGNPNRYGRAGDRQPSPDQNDFDPLALAAGVAEADQLRRGGTRIVAVGVGDVRTESLQAVSGPTRDRDWFVGNFDAVAASVATVATELCGTRLRAQARIDGIPAPSWPFTVGDTTGRTTRSTGPDGGVFFVLPTTTEPRSVRLSSRRGLGKAELAAVNCTRNNRPIDADVSIAEATASLPVSPNGVVSCDFDYERNPGAGGGDPGVPGTEERVECEGYRNTGTALTPLSTIALYVQLRRTICNEAGRFHVNELLLAVLIQHEGYNRSKLVQGRFDKWIENQVTIPIPFVGSNDTVGVGQMRPDLARRLARTHFDIYDDLSEDAIRRQLVYDTTFAVRMAAAYLAELQTTFSLTDRQTFITYAFGAKLVPRLRRSEFDGPMARPRGKKYDRLEREIVQRGEDFA